MNKIIVQIGNYTFDIRSFFPKSYYLNGIEIH